MTCLVRAFRSILPFDLGISSILPEHGLEPMTRKSMREKPMPSPMPVLAAALAAALLAMPVAATPALAHHGKAAEHQEMAKAKKAKATKKPKAKKEEYMRAAPYR
jgi:hypothetical protein